MKEFPFITLLFVALTAKAQYDSPFDTALIAQGLSKITTLKDDMTKISMPERCENKSNPSTMIACSMPEEDIDKSVIIKAEFEPGKIDPRLNAVIPEEFRKDTKTKKHPV